MTYVFDTNAFSQLFHSYYRDRFPSLWAQFNSLVEAGAITSTREVAREIEDDRVVALRDWAKKHTHLFPAPSAEEARVVSLIFSVDHFQQVIETKKLYKGGKNADPFVVARAWTLDGIVVTMERERPNAARIPNICRHFDVECISLEGFMEREGWRF